MQLLCTFSRTIAVRSVGCISGDQAGCNATNKRHGEKQKQKYFREFIFERSRQTRCILNPGDQTKALRRPPLKPPTFQRPLLSLSCSTTVVLLHTPKRTASAHATKRRTANRLLQQQQGTHSKTRHLSHHQRKQTRTTTAKNRGSELPRQPPQSS